MAENKQDAPEAAAPGSLTDVMDRIRTRSEEPPTPSEPEDTEPAAPAPEADTQAEATPETPAEGPNDAKIETPPETDETPTPAPEKAPDSEAEGSPAADTPEPVESAPETAESVSADEDPVALEVHGGKTFHRSDLYDDEKFAEFKQELARGYMREDAYSRQRKKDREEVDTLVQNVTQQMEDRLALVAEIMADPDMVRILSEYGAGSDLTRRLIKIPEAARGILRNPAQKEELERVLAIERDNPDLRTTRESSERIQAENAALKREREAYAANADLLGFAGALQQSIDNFAAAYPEADPVEVSNAILQLGGLSHEDFAVEPGQLNEAKVAAGLDYLRRFMVSADPTTGQPVVRPDLLEREFERSRLKKTLSTTAPAPTNGKHESHNAAVKAQLEEDDDGPPAVPAGSAPGAGVAPEPAKELSEVRDRLLARAREASG